MPGSTQVPGGSQHAFAYGTLTLCGRLSHTFLLACRFLTPFCRALQPPLNFRPAGLGCFPFARHYSENRFFSSGYLDVSVPQVPFPYPMCSDKGCHRSAVAGFPIRISPDQRLYTAPRDFSQCPTSFFGIWRQGIHRKLLLASLPDTENSIFFAFSFSFFCALTHRFSAMLFHYSLGKVQGGKTVLCLKTGFPAVEMTGLEPVTSALQRRRSPN